MKCGQKICRFNIIFSFQKLPKFRTAVDVCAEAAVYFKNNNNKIVNKMIIKKPLNITQEEYNLNINKMTREERVQYMEDIAYSYFNKTNSKTFKFIRRSKDVFSFWDCSGETTNNKKFVVEFKIRNYSSKDFLGCILENQKLKALRDLWVNNDSLHIVYINYLSDIGYSFNLSSRFKQGCNSEISATYFDYVNHFSLGDNNYKENKLVNYLHYSVEDWFDKIIKYN